MPHYFNEVNSIKGQPQWHSSSTWASAKSFGASRRMRTSARNDKIKIKAVIKGHAIIGLRLKFNRCDFLLWDAAGHGHKNKQELSLEIIERFLSLLRQLCRFLRLFAEGGCIAQREHSASHPAAKGLNPSFAKIFFSLLLSSWTVLRSNPSKQWISQMQLAVTSRAKCYKKIVCQSSKKI